MPRAIWNNVVDADIDLAAVSGRLGCLPFRRTLHPFLDGVVTPGGMPLTAP